MHWSFEQLITLEHDERRRWVTEVARINRRLNQVNEPQGISLEEW